ncbi:MAG: hypothetical protein ACI39G_01760 [Pseudoramibacter sp.]
MSVKSNILKIGGGILLGAFGGKFLKSKPAKSAGVHIIAGAKIAGSSIKDGFEKCQASCSNAAAEADIIKEDHFVKKDQAYRDKVKAEYKVLKPAYEAIVKEEEKEESAENAE